MLATTQHLAELIEAKHACLVELRDLSRRQATLIDSGDLTELLRMFAGKQRLIEQLHAVERAFDPYRQQDPDRRVWRTAGERERCATLLGQAQALFDEVLEQERENEANLKLRRDEVASKLQMLQSASEARQAYADSSEFGTAGLDLAS